MFGILLEKLRHDKKYSRKQLAKVSDLSISYIGLLERNDKKTPSRTAITRLANGLELDDTQTNELFLSAGYTSDADYKFSKDLSYKTTCEIESLKNLPQPPRRYCSRLIKILKSTLPDEKIELNIKKLTSREERNMRFRENLKKYLELISDESLLECERLNYQEEINNFAGYLLQKSKNKKNNTS